jgi:hypothetical protein
VGSIVGEGAEGGRRRAGHVFGAGSLEPAGDDVHLGRNEFHGGDQFTHHLRVEPQQLFARKEVMEIVLDWYLDSHISFLSFFATLFFFF